MKSFIKTDQGKTRNHNEDYIYNNDKNIGCLDNLYIVCDGVGGENYGEIASKTAVESFTKYIKKNKKELNNNDAYKEFLQDATFYASNSILKKAQEDKKYYRMCTTIVACTIKNNILHVINAGDSRLYILKKKTNEINEENTIFTLTKDNAKYQKEYVLPDEILKNITEKYNDIDVNALNPMIRERKYITKALGVDKEIQADYYEYDLTDDLENNDYVKILLCTDGVYNMINDEKIFEILMNKSLNGNKAIEKLIQTGNDLGGLDNLSAILIEL